MTLPPPTGIPPIPIVSHLSLTPVPEAGHTATSMTTPFVELVGNTAKQTRDMLNETEHLEKQAAAGLADPQDVATKVVSARAMVQQFSSLLRASVAAYQEVMRINL